MVLDNFTSYNYFKLLINSSCALYIPQNLFSFMSHYYRFTVLNVTQFGSGEDIIYFLYLLVLDLQR